MADIATVLKKTIDGLPKNNPDIRQKVYAKARASILGRLEAKEPKPDQATIDKQMAGIDRIISAVESEYAFKDQVEDVLGESLGSVEPEPAKPAAVVPTPPAPAFPAPSFPPADSMPPRLAEPAVDPAAGGYPPATSPISGPETKAGDAPSAAGEAFTRDARKAPPPPRKAGGSGLKMAAWAVVLVAILGAAGYAAWINQDALRSQFDSFMTSSGDPSGSTEQTTPEEVSGGDNAAADATAPEKKPANGQEEAKFTQRLLADGSEVDAGAADGAPSVGEGTSVAQASQPQSDAAAAGNDGADTAATDQPADTGETMPADETPQTVAVGQRAIFYEEQTSSDQETADQGNVVWSQVEESPGEGAPREPAIRADVSIPGMDLTLRMTIRRNIDKTLPASHLIELVFVTPEGFPGGAVDDVLRVAFKDTEQSAGNPLIGLPVKIDDGLFLYAMTDGAAETETNTTLMRRQSWIDVTILYKTGRRALITMEKGIPGSQVFDETLKAWSASAPAGG